jgi:hypothetical protein
MLIYLFVFLTSFSGGISAKTSNINQAGNWNAKYRSQLRVMIKKDQSARANLNNHKLLRVDRENDKCLKRLILKYGWPTFDRVGKAASHAAFILILHQDQDIAFQKRALKAAHRLMQQGQIMRRSYAYLYDRVMHHERKKQLWGTQGRCTKTGKWRPFPIEDPKNINKRRKKAGMIPVSEGAYKKLLMQYCSRESSKFQEKRG